MVDLSQEQAVDRGEALRENFLRRATIGDMVRRQAGRNADRLALIAYEVDGSRVEMTYRDVDVSANRVANALAADGVRRGDVVAMMSFDKGRLAIAYLACLKLGAAFTPINPGYRPWEVARQLDHADPAALLVSSATWDVARAGLEDSTSVPLTIGGSADLSWDHLLEWGAADEPETIVDENDLALLIYTSGTESAPKGVAITHRNMLISTTPSWTTTQYVEHDDVFLLLAPLYTTAGLGTITTLLSIGATVVLTETTEPAAVIETIRTEGITNTSQTPTFYNRLVSHPGFETADLKTLRQCHVYGGRIPKRAVERLRIAAPEVVWATYWGQSELSQLGTIGFFGSMDDVPGQDTRWIGVPVPHLEVRVVGEDGQDAEIGEMWCRSPSVMAGYHKDPAATAEALRDGWLHTGDIVRLDGHGNLFFLDRSKDMIKTGGMNVSSAEVESILADHPGVEDVAVVGVADAEWSEAVVAVVVATPGTSPEVAELTAFCKERLAGYKVPKRMYLVDELPRDGQGKVRKRVIRASLVGDGAR